MCIEKNPYEDFRYDPSEFESDLDSAMIYDRDHPEKDSDVKDYIKKFIDV